MFADRPFIWHPGDLTISNVLQPVLGFNLREWREQESCAAPHLGHSFKKQLR